MIWGGIYPGMITATIGTVFLIGSSSPRSSSCGADSTTRRGTRCISSPTRRSHSAGSIRSRPATSSCSTGRRRLLALAVRRDDRRNRRLAPPAAGLERGPSSTRRHRRDRGGARRRLAAHHRPQPGSTARASPGSSSSGVFSHGAPGGPRIRSRSRPRRGATRSASRSSRSATTPAAWGRSALARAWSPRARSGSSRSGAPPGQGLARRGRHRHHPGACAARGDWTATSSCFIA